MAEINLVEANRARALLFTHHNVQRLEKIGRAGIWTGWTPAEGLEGMLVQDNLIRYQRPGTGDPNYAVVFFGNPKMCDIKNVDFGEEIVVKSDVTERYSDVIDNTTAVEYDEEITHTFSKTRSLLQQAKIGVELSVKTSVGASYSGVNASVDVSAKIAAEYSRQWGEESNTTDTIKRTIRVPGNTSIHYEATRSIDKTQRKIKATTDFEHDCTIVSGPNNPGNGNRPMLELEWGSWSEFIEIAKGFAAADKAGYDIFKQFPLSESEIAELENPTQNTVEFVVDYDCVQHQSIRIY